LRPRWPVPTTPCPPVPSVGNGDFASSFFLGAGANGVSAGEDPNWNNAQNINARIADGVISISQYNPGGNWGNTISGLRPQLDMPSSCP
jgi:hypothetical protein